MRNGLFRGKAGCCRVRSAENEFLYVSSARLDVYYITCLLKKDLCKYITTEIKALSPSAAPQYALIAQTAIREVTVESKQQKQPKCRLLLENADKLSGANRTGFSLIFLNSIFSINTIRRVDAISNGPINGIDRSGRIISSSKSNVIVSIGAAAIGTCQGRLIQSLRRQIQVTGHCQR